MKLLNQVRKEVEAKCLTFYLENNRSLSNLRTFVSLTLPNEEYNILGGEHGEKASHLVSKWNTVEVKTKTVTLEDVLAHYEHATEVECLVDKKVCRFEKESVKPLWLRQEDCEYFIQGYGTENHAVLYSNGSWAKILKTTSIISKIEGLINDITPVTVKPKNIYTAGTNMNINLSSTDPVQVEACKNLVTPKLDENLKPKQYQIGIDTMDRAEANMTYEGRMASAAFLIDKYNWRKKDETESDLTKIIAYATWALKQYRTEQEKQKV